MKRLIVGLTALLFSAAPALAQEVGKTQWNGYPVVLNADGTWFFDCGGYGASLSKQIRMAFCFDPETWTIGSPQGVQEFMYLSKDDTTGVIVIPDTSIYPMADLHAAVPISAAENGSTTVEAISASEAPSINVAGRIFMGTRYKLSVEGTEFSYLDYHTSGDAGTAQVIFWTAPGDEAQADAKAKVLLNQIVFGD
ncbi:MAG: hypothetical protein EOP19_14090 [Hyphomicrobiales bacterium]|nr:MAG: hypothetical protein EOP19_14090 [Hyphomicrobiales bacterium]